MNILIWLGIVLMVLSAPQMLPWFRRRMAERGFSGSIAIPRFLTLWGVLAVLIGLLWASL